MNVNILINKMGIVLFMSNALEIVLFDLILFCQILEFSDLLTNACQGCLARTLSKFLLLLQNLISKKKQQVFFDKSCGVAFL